MSDTKIVSLDGKPWTERLIRDRAKPPRPVGNLANCVTALRHAPSWRGVLSYNTFTHTILTTRKTPWGESYAAWTDTADGLCAVWMQEEGINVPSHIAAQAVRIVAHDQEISPLTDYLSSLAWDGEPRINSWTCDYLGVKDTVYSRAVGQAWLISAVARAFQPGCKADNVLILEGPQGRGKSSALRALASPEWFADYISENLNSKDAAILCDGVWIIEFSELEGVVSSHSDKAETAKAFLTRQKDRYRPPYATHPIDVPRQCVFAGTTNRDNYMTDETGNRRFWPLRCNFIYPERVARDRDQLWAEAVYRYHAGMPWWLDADEEAEAKYEQKLRYEGDPWEEIIRDWTEGKRDTSVQEILEKCLRKDAQAFTRSDQMRVSRCLKVLGWDQSRVPGTGVRRYKR